MLFFMISEFTLPSTYFSLYLNNIVEVSYQAHIWMSRERDSFIFKVYNIYINLKFEKQR